MVINVMCKVSVEVFLICNGYKDMEYVRMVFVVCCIGFNIVIVFE